MPLQDVMGITIPSLKRLSPEAQQIPWDSADSEEERLDIIRVEICPMMLDYKLKIKQLREVLPSLVSIVVNSPYEE